MKPETVENLQSRLLDLHETNQVILAKAESENRDLASDEQKDFDANAAEFERLSGDLDRMLKVQKQAALLNAAVGRKTEPQAVEPQHPSSAPAVQSPHRQPQASVLPRVELREDKGKWGWRYFGEFAKGVHQACAVYRGAAGSIDPRLIMNAPTTYGSEGVGADGGFIVPPDFRAEVWQKVGAEESLLSRTDQLTSSSNTITFTKDETTPWQTSGGVLAYWDGEGDALAQSKPSFQTETLRLNKLTALVPVTEELTEDAGALDAYLRRKVPQKLDYKLTDAIVNGTGVGQPLGLLNADSIVSVAKESSQVATTLVAENILKMYSRMYAPLRSRAIWLINQDVEPQLWQAVIKVKNVAGTENVGGAPIFIPPGGLSASPYGTLLGRPVVPCQACQTLGTTGDIYFVDLQSYLTVVKAGGLRTDVSMHLYFDYDMLAYRFILRVAGQPWWTSSITVAKGSNALSWCVKLDTRS